MYRISLANTLTALKLPSFIPRKYYQKNNNYSNFDYPMLPRYCARRTRTSSSKRISSIRVKSTIIGDSGRTYTDGEVLRRHPEDKRFDIYKAKSADVKPDNILVDWISDDEGNKVVTDVALGDFDIACKLMEGETRHTPHAVGNAMWRSPEGQTGISTMASDIYSLGLVYIYALGGADLLILNDYQKLAKAGVTPEQEVLTRHFCYFGPVPESLYQQIKDKKWRHALQLASSMAEAEVKERPMLRLRAWGQELGESALDLLSAMTNIDPKGRLTIDQVLAHPYWQECDS
ncbi:hypothetical protein KC320_g4301 [Hortaea werneckii]|nr:hypothetical protein KC320_g4301 [Hortaea werneckii]